jgi:hypothetical protein
MLAWLGEMDGVAARHVLRITRSIRIWTGWLITLGYLAWFYILQSIRSFNPSSFRMRVERVHDTVELTVIPGRARECANPESRAAASGFSDLQQHIRVGRFRGAPE